MDINTLIKLTQILHKTAQQRRRIVPRWQESQPNQTGDSIPEQETGFLGSFQDMLDEPSRGEVFHKTPEEMAELEKSIPGIGIPGAPEAPPRGAPKSGPRSRPEQVEKKPEYKEKSEKDLLNEYWADKGSTGHGYKPKFLGDFDPSTVETGKPLPKGQSPSSGGGSVFSDFLKSVEDLEKEENFRKKKEEEGAEEESRFQQGSERLTKIDEEITDKMDKVKQLLILPKLFGKAEMNPRGPKSPNADNPPSQLVKAFKQIRDGGGDAKMVKVMFPKTPYTEAFVSWVLARVDSDTSEIRELLSDVQKLHGNKKDIQESKSMREKRLTEKKPRSFEDYFK